MSDAEIYRCIRNWVVGLTIIGTLCVFAGMAGCPKYNVYVQDKKGEAELKRAEQNRQIIVQSAQAQKEAAEFEKEAEIIKAEGIAKALEIVKEQLQDMTTEEARVLVHWKWVQGLNDESSQVIYVPTEANLPILLEAGRIANSDGPTDKGHKIEAELGRDLSNEKSESSEQIRE